MSTAPSIAGLTDTGKARARNEDSICLLPELGVAVVADGMGGHPGGNVASRIAAESVASSLAAALDRIDGTTDAPTLGGAMERSIRVAHEDIRAEGRRTPELDGMGTTLTALVVDPEATAWALGHVGDSRAYVFRDGVLDQLTRDDTWVQDRVDAFQLTPQQARRHPFAHLLTKCLGLESPPVPSVLEGDLHAGDLFLLCTDGLVGMLDDEQLAYILSEHLDSDEPASESVEALVRAANDAGGTDNITAAIVRISEV